jgi:hypothetical protein
VRSGGPDRIIRVVSERGVRVLLELEADEPISGRAFQGQRLIAAFSGWLELYSAIELARRGAGTEQGAPPSLDQNQGGEGR